MSQTFLMLRILPFLMILNIPAFAQTENVLQHIRDRYQEINKNIQSYRVETVDIPGISTEGADVTGYFAGDTLQMIVEAVYGEMAKSRLEVYYDKGAPVFFYDREYRYEVPMYDSTFNEHKMAIDEERTYFHQGKMVRWIDQKNRTFTVRNAAFIKKEQEYLESAADLYSTILKQRPGR